MSETKEEREIDETRSSAGEVVPNDTSESDILAKSRATFQKLAVQYKTNYKTLADVNKIIEVLTNWDSANPSVAKNRKANKMSYYYYNKFKIVENKNVHELHTKKEIQGTRILPIEEVFDVIFHYHVDAGGHHQSGVRSTYKLLQT